MITIERLNNGYNLIESICSKIERDIVYYLNNHPSQYPNYEFEHIYNLIERNSGGGIISYQYYNFFVNNFYDIDGFIFEYISITISLFVWGTNRNNGGLDDQYSQYVEMPNYILKTLDYADNICVFNKLQKLYWENPANFKQLFSEVNI